MPTSPGARDDRVMSRCDRRAALRVATGLPLCEIVEEEPLTGTATDLGPGGLFLERPATGAPMRRTGVVQLELPLPKSGDAIWVKGRIVYHVRTPMVHGTAIAFTAMAKRHQRMLDDWLEQVRIGMARLTAWGLVERRRAGAPRVAPI